MYFHVMRCRVLCLFAKLCTPCMLHITAFMCGICHEYVMTYQDAKRTLGHNCCWRVHIVLLLVRCVAACLDWPLQVRAARLQVKAVDASAETAARAT